MRSRLLGFTVLFCGLSGLPLRAQNPALARPPVDFQRVVRPILSENCFHCHGPDANTRMADLRLDTREGVFAKRENGAPVVPGNLQASLVYQRITQGDPALRMPPESSHKVLTDAQKDILKRWIADGATWKEHWSFVSPSRSSLPVVKKKEWVRNPIDAFVLAKLEAAGLEPGPEADRRALVRRLSLDLTGLPPSPEEVEQFVNDSSPQAYEQMVDRMMASKHWGEHRGRYWLDAARYADTHGIHIDNYREMWPYRDWVINAFNRNLSFDRFTIEQIAGDLLPNRTIDQQIASGFHRCNVTTNEGGAIPEEFEAIYAKDRVDTTGTVFLGLTVGCATCHDHKFDPISTKDFYSMAAFFRNTTQDSMDGNIPDTPPILVVPKGADVERWDKLNREDRALVDQLDEERKKSGKAFDKWLLSKSRTNLTASPASPKPCMDASAQVAALTLGSEASLQYSGRTETIALKDGLALGDGPQSGSKALHFGEKSQLEIPDTYEFKSDKAFSISGWILSPQNDDDFVIASQMNPEEKNRGWLIELSRRVPMMRLTGDEGKSIVARAEHLRQLKPGTWNHLVVTYDGSREQAGMSLYLNGKRILALGNETATQLKGEIHTGKPLRLGSDGKRHYQGGAIADFRIFSRALTGDEAQLAFVWSELYPAFNKGIDQLTAVERQNLHLFYLIHEDKAYRRLLSERQQVYVQQRDIRRRSAVTHVMQERGDSQPMAHILYRGQYDQPRQEVQPNVPAALPPMPASFPRNRLGLAQWLVDPSNPLTARVTVNRFWQELFGTGLVKSSEDFGSQGQAPSHPELLDWLAVEFRESGWDVKRFFKLLVTSSAYRQSSQANEAKLKADPENRLLSRGPRFRMDGEMVRDYALAASGLLVPSIGGPSVKPYQPQGIWETVAMIGSNTQFYKQDSGDKLYRRSLYTFWKRSAPPASMEIFGAPTRESCTVRRERTDTPLQALVVMNDPQFVEAARALAQRALKSANGNIDGEIDFVTTHLLGRAFDVNEKDITRKAYQDYLEHFVAHPDEAKKLLSVGESKPDEQLAGPESAALTMVANQVMNLDEGLNK
jgi:Protein of unknown function (DUF1553)/Protein of unknown function (DUF1549)/Concanavalin A-like lectin/glucanases superfamily/Planctomycete cytochrome C